MSFGIATGRHKPGGVLFLLQAHYPGSRLVGPVSSSFFTMPPGRGAGCLRARYTSGKSISVWNFCVAVCLVVLT